MLRRLFGYCIFSLLLGVPVFAEGVEVKGPLFLVETDTEAIRPGAAETKSPSENLLSYLLSGGAEVKKIRDLIEEGADVNAKDDLGIAPLHAALHYKHLDAAELLLQHGANVRSANIEGNTPLELAMMMDHKEIVELLKKTKVGERI